MIAYLLNLQTRAVIPELLIHLKLPVSLNPDNQVSFFG